MKTRQSRHCGKGQMLLNLAEISSGQQRTHARDVSGTHLPSPTVISFCEYADRLEREIRNKAYHKIAALANHLG